MKVLKNIWATLFCVALSMGIASCGDDPEKMEPSPGHTKQQGIEGIWQKLKPDESLSQFTFNSDGTGVYCEGDPGDYDYEQIRYVYDEESNAITIYFYDWTLHCSITELTSKKLTWIEDEEGDRVNTYYKTDKPAQKNDPDGKVDGHEYVDLGLPSGTLWATCNVGASKPEQLGNYFAWGETKAKSDYSWNSYKYCNGSKNSLTKYNSESDLGSVVDNKEKLDLEDDAAYVNWGGEWRMPSYSQLKELRGHSTAIWTTENGVYGMKMVSKENGKFIFLPAAGYRVDKDLNNEDYGYYWSRSLGDALSFSSGMTNMTSSNRCCGLSVRPVVCQNDEEEDIDPGEINTGQTTSKYTKQSKDELEVTQTSAVVTQVHNAKFDKDGILTSYTLTSTWGTEEWANAYYEELKNESDMKVSKKGKTVTADMTTSFEGCTYDLIKGIFDSWIAESGIVNKTVQLLQAGTSYIYAGTGNAESLIANGANFTSDKKVSGNFNVSVKVASTGTSADLTIPAFTCGSLSMSECTFGSLILSTKDNHNVLTTDENNTTILGTVTYNGQTVDVSNLYIDCTLDDSQIYIKLMSIYFGEPNEAGIYPYAMNFSYSGKVVTM